MFNRPPVIDMRHPEMQEAELKPSYITRILGFIGLFPSLSREFKGLVPPGEIAQIGGGSWGHRLEAADPNHTFGSAGMVRSWRYLALTHEGVRVVRKELFASPRGEESLRGCEVVGSPNCVTAVRVARADTPNQLRERVAEVAERFRAA